MKQLSLTVGNKASIVQYV